MNHQEPQIVKDLLALTEKSTPFLIQYPPSKAVLFVNVPIINSYGFFFTFLLYLFCNYVTRFKLSGNSDMNTFHII